jgi:uncharacterized protein (DUF1499 family)
MARVLVPRAALVLALASALALALAGLGYRWGWWGLATSFSVLRAASFAGAGVALLALIGVALTALARAWPGLALAVAALAIAGVVVWVPLSLQKLARTVPSIHDITTDTENPPEFVAVVPLRRNAPNPTDYGGAGLAAQQRAAYADLKPVFLKVSPEQAFVNALAVARDMGWEIVDAQASEGRIEATDTTFWFGFKDDVVVRIKAADQGSRIDVRSVSRVGKSDVGTNAKRIRAYLERLTR